MKQPTKSAHYFLENPHSKTLAVRELMRATVYEITPCPKGRLATMARPRGGDWLVDELASLKALGVSPQKALTLISKARGFEIPDTEEQRSFILGFDKGMAQPA